MFGNIVKGILFGTGAFVGYKLTKEYNENGIEGVKRAILKNIEKVLKPKETEDVISEKN